MKSYIDYANTCYIDKDYELVGILEIDEKTTLKSWTMMETIVGVTGLVCAVVISLFA